MNFTKEDDLLILEYDTLNAGQIFVNSTRSYEVARIRKTFYIEVDDLIIETDEELKTREDIFEHIKDEHELKIKIGELSNDYYVIEGRILGVDNPVYLHKDVIISRKTFVANRDISIFRRLQKITDSNSRIGPGMNDIPEEEFDKLIKLFPTSTELNKYTASRISSILNQYIETTSDYINEYNQYMNKKFYDGTMKSSFDFIDEYELTKYQMILKKMQHMLENEGKYLEKDWQNEIAKIVLLLFPKYLYVFDEVPIKVHGSSHKKRLDYMLVDSNGNIDIVEIKKPRDFGVISARKYRDNHIPLMELSGTIMQIEKYIMYLNQWNYSGEVFLTDKYKSQLSEDFRIKIVNPSGIIIMGREENLTDEQLKDLEVIKRKYKNVVDIITYDDLVRRLEHLIIKFQDK